MGWIKMTIDRVARTNEPAIRVGAGGKTTFNTVLRERAFMAKGKRYDVFRGEGEHDGLIMLKIGTEGALACPTGSGSSSKAIGREIALVLGRPATPGQTFSDFVEIGPSEVVVRIRPSSTPKKAVATPLEKLAPQDHHSPPVHQRIADIVKDKISGPESPETCASRVSELLDSREPIHPSDLTPEQLVQAFQLIASGESVKVLKREVCIDRNGMEWIWLHYAPDFDSYMKLRSPGARQNFSLDLLARLKKAKTVKA